jgi:hypothetical protein
VITATMKGFPKTWHYTVDLDRIEYLLSNAQIQVFPDTENSSKSKRRYLLTTVYGETKNCKSQKLEKPDQSTGENPTLSEEHIDELKSKTHSDKNQEEEGQPVFQNLDPAIIQELLDFKVFKSKLPEVDAAGWTPAQIRWLIDKCKQDDRRGSPAALFLTRLREVVPPTLGYGYSQYIPEPVDAAPRLEDQALDVIRAVLETPLGPDLPKLMGHIKIADLQEAKAGLELKLECPDYLWGKFVEPYASAILEKLQPLGIVNVYA